MIYTPIHVHTDRSNNGAMKDSINKVDTIVKRLKAIGVKAWAISDHGTMSNVVNAYKASSKAGIKLIPGYEGYLTGDLSIQQRDLRHITLWAKDNIGYRNLNIISKHASGNNGLSPNNYYYKPRVDIELLRKYSEGLMIGSACLGGWLQRKTEEGVVHDDTLLSVFIDIFGKDNVFLEIHTYQGEGQRQHNEFALAMAEKYDVLPVVATDAHFAFKNDFELWKLFKNTSNDVEGDETLGDTLYLQDADEIRVSLSYLPSNIVEQAIINTNVIAEKSNVTIDFSSKHYPHFPCDDEYEAVRKKCKGKWQSIVDSGVDTKTYGERIKRELGVLKLQEYCGYFLITGDYIEHAVSKGIPVGPGRGSACGSYVANLCNITKLDSIALDLTFERFAHDARLAPPDIDVDVTPKGRSHIIEYLRSKYGEVYQVRTFSTMAPPGAIRLSGKALGLPTDYIDTVAKSLAKYESDDEDDDTSTYDQKMWQLDNIRNDENSELIDIAKRFVGICVGYGKHASAVIILDKDIDNFCAIERQVDSKTKLPTYIAACEYPLLEAQGLMKADLLGLKCLQVIDDTAKVVGINIDTIPLDDAKTSAMLCEGYTQGCFQIESPGMTHLVKQIRPRSFNDLIPLVALYRPGPLNAIVEPIKNTDNLRKQYSEELAQWINIEKQSSKESKPSIAKRWNQWKWNNGTLSPNDVKKYTMVQTYVGVKNWTELHQWTEQGNTKESWEHWDTITFDELIEPAYLHESLRPILESTYSIVLYQEQIMEIAKQLCGYTLGEADNIRRIIGKKKVDEMKPALDSMIERGVSNGIPRDVMDAITTQIVEFAMYCFNKSHSAAYGLLSYQTAYLKANYQKEYMCSMINSEDNSHKDIIPYIKECKELGMSVFPPSLPLKNREWVIEGNGLRTGLHYVKGIGNNMNLNYIDTFESIVSHNPKDVSTALIKAGAMDSFGESRGAMLSKVSSVQETLKLIDKCQAKVDENSEALSQAVVDKDIKKYRRQLDQWKTKLSDAKAKVITASEGDYDDTIGEIETLGYSEGIKPNVKVGKLTNVYSKVVSNGSTMGWVTLKSDYGEFRCSAFEDHWLTFKDLITVGASYLFVCKETAFGFNLVELSINGKVYAAPKKSYGKR